MEGFVKGMMRIGKRERERERERECVCVCVSHLDGLAEGIDDGPARLWIHHRIEDSLHQLEHKVEGLGFRAWN
jgi:hypothetical protein